MATNNVACEDRRLRHAMRVPQAVLALSVVGMLCASAAKAAPEDAAHSPPGHSRRVNASSTLESRVETLSKALELDSSQQMALRKILEKQRDQVATVWSDAAVPAAYRISATRSISEHTADQIRALLNEEQKKKFTPPRQQRDADTSSAAATLEAWMSSTGLN